MSTWVEQILATDRGDVGYLDLIQNRPLVAWFQTKKKAVQRLVKVNARLGDGEWILVGRGAGFVQGLDEKNSPEHELHTTVSPTSLMVCLRTLTAANGWELREFKTELEFCQAAMQYYRQP